MVSSTNAGVLQKILLIYFSGSVNESQFYRSIINQLKTIYIYNYIIYHYQLKYHSIIIYPRHLDIS
jgi:hypothetical protein